MGGGGGGGEGGKEALAMEVLNTPGWTGKKLKRTKGRKQYSQQQDVLIVTKDWAGRGIETLAAVFFSVVGCVFSTEVTWSGTDRK